MLARKTATTLEAHHAVEIIKQAFEKFGVPEFLDLRCGGHSGVEENQKTFIGDSLSHFATNDTSDVYDARTACGCNHTLASERTHRSAV